MGLEWGEACGKLPAMKTVTVDPQRRIRIGGEAPETKFWLLPQPNGYLLHRIQKPEGGKKMSVEDAKVLIRKHRVILSASCAEIMKTTREID